MLRRTLFVELDTGGSWRPRSDHYATLRRWIVGPLSFGWIAGNFDDFVGAFRELAKDAEAR